ncbi:hypothetical protein WHR41_00930 [Cladosporium halotolerans]|uniref:C2H2-type domain-containing protein n=1 Tax=Cladosporium halotolerans TaxID=1052096 RepID=A0AB34L538_9PEZI
MSSTTLHPRRRPASPSMTPSLLDSFQNMSIRKWDTFHVPHKHDKDLWDPLASSAKKSTTPSMPARSTTCPKSLEDLLIGSGERRAADLLHRVDQAIATQSKLALGHVLSEPEVLPVPEADDSTCTQMHVRQSSRHSHSSDSGIGSSVASESGKCPTTDSPDLSSASKSMSAISAATEERGLSEYAKEQIHRHIIQPILREPSLKEFHQLLKDVPHRIGSREIKNLRDLEKTLIFCAPDYSRTPRKYLHFCERTIRVLHTTVTTLHESDQRAPTDRPYTQGYFFDLVEQIRRYATILAATRERQAKGEKAEEMDYSPDETVSLHGGLSHNGKPAELVRHKDGKTISLATGRVLSSDETAHSSSKRAMSDAGLDDADDDDVLRSMARRKKNAKPEIHECPQCEKEFKRPCDLTKHIKTHDRPYKCPNTKCKYHEYGWPTEKECERHVNDKHSAAPSLYHCLFKPCPYTSKRESNCKQHMEKAHGWAYVRSKNNGKGKASEVSRLPKGPVPPSPSSMMLTPLTPIAPSPSTSAQSWATGSRHSSMAPPPVPSHYGTPAFVQPSPDFAGHFNMDFDFNNMEAFPMTPALSEDRRDSASTSDSGMMFDSNSNTFAANFSPNDFSFDTTYQFGDFNMQQQTPDSAVGPSSSNIHSHPSIHGGVLVGSNDQQVSPHAQMADPTFTPDLYDDMNVDDTFASDVDGQDFTLFGARAPATSAGEMFPSLAEGSGNWGNFAGQYDNSKQQTLRMRTESSVLHELFPELNN